MGFYIEWVPYVPVLSRPFGEAIEACPIEAYVVAESAIAFRPRPRPEPGDG